jgi:signal transduction histidine kinase
MYERAALIAATLTVERAPEGGTEVRLEVPVARSQA